jgi:hypothetical protein
MNERTSRDIVKQRSHGTCEVMIPGVCMGQAHSMHHRKNRSQGGTWDVENILHVCGDGVRGCHGWITEHPKDSYEMGWAVRSFWNPTDVAVSLRGRHVFLTPSGGMNDMPPQA